MTFPPNRLRTTFSSNDDPLEIVMNRIMASPEIPQLCRPVERARLCLLLILFLEFV